MGNSQPEEKQNNIWSKCVLRWQEEFVEEMQKVNRFSKQLLYHCPHCVHTVHTVLHGVEPVCSHIELFGASWSREKNRWVSVQSFWLPAFFWPLHLRYLKDCVLSLHCSPGWGAGWAGHGADQGADKGAGHGAGQRSECQSALEWTRHLRWDFWNFKRWT